MENLIDSILVWPFLAFIISLFLSNKSESLISRFAFIAIVIQAFFVISLIILWVSFGSIDINIQKLTVYKGDHLHFYVDFLFDRVTAVFGFIGVFITFLILPYSKVYMHREQGYKRFFNTVLLFYAGYNLSVFSGNLETLFIGWEILGLTSFLLVAFYRDRYLPVKNAYKVFSIYRIGDVGIILAMWALHHMWHANITFTTLQNDILLNEHFNENKYLGVFISLMILLSAAAKSAQFPFSTWLPRAMEGPTPSSAIFYGSLSVHMGVLLLLRTSPIWDQQLISKILLATAGIITALFGFLVSRVQASLKSQIAYASIAQIGLMFVELAFGFKTLALIHFAGNAFLRTYQLLVSPSAVSYLIREQFYNFSPKKQAIQLPFYTKITNTFYLLGLNEFNMDSILDKFLWKPFKNLGNILRFINIKNIYFISIPALLLGITIKIFRYNLPNFLLELLPEFMALIGLLMVLRAYAGRKNVFVVWSLLIMNHCWVLLSVSFNEALSFQEILFYISGIVVFGIVGFITLFMLKKKEPTIDLNSFQGHVYEYPKTAILFLLSCLGLAGFPITPTFVGEDIIFAHIEYNQFFLAFYVSLGFVISGIALIRMYSRIFLGPHSKHYHEKALKNG
jgi:NADH-quinone oxidoreductase subunit L